MCHDGWGSNDAKVVCRRLGYDVTCRCMGYDVPGRHSWCICKHLYNVVCMWQCWGAGFSSLGLLAGRSKLLEALWNWLSSAESSSSATCERDISKWTQYECTTANKRSYISWSAFKPHAVNNIVSYSQSTLYPDLTHPYPLSLQRSPKWVTQQTNRFTFLKDTHLHGSCLTRQSWGWFASLLCSVGALCCLLSLVGSSWWSDPLNVDAGISAVNVYTKACWEVQFPQHVWWWMDVPSQLTPAKW